MATRVDDHHHWPLGSRSIAVPFALCTIAPSARVAWVQTSVTFEAQPATFDVPTWVQQIQVRLVLRNPGGDALLQPMLAWFTNDGFTVAPINPKTFTVPRLDPLDTLA